MSDPTEELLSRLGPAPPSTELMARLRAARPTRALRVHRPGLGTRGSGRTSVWRRVAFVGALGAAAALVILSQMRVPLEAIADRHPATPNIATETTPRESSRVFLPVESRWTLVSLQPTRVIQEPDEAPRRFMRAVWIDDLTAVGAETDAALHVRSVHETYVPVSSPVY
jgi:hypothetical protein